MNHYEYKIVWGSENSPEAAKQIAQWAAEGFRVVFCAAAGNQIVRSWCWTMEREVSSGPYR